LGPPAGAVEEIVVFGACQLTAQGAALCLDRGIEVSFISLRGRFRGRLQPPEGKKIVLRRAQFRRAEDYAFRLSFGRAIVGAKLASQ